MACEEQIECRPFKVQSVSVTLPLRTVRLHVRNTLCAGDVYMAVLAIRQGTLSRILIMATDVANKITCKMENGTKEMSIITMIYDADKNSLVIKVEITMHS